MPIPRQNSNVWKNFMSYEDEKSILKEQNIEKNHKNLVEKSLDIRSYIKDSLSGFIPQNKFLASEMSSSLRKVRLNK